MGDPHRPPEDPLGLGGLGDHWVKLEHHLLKTHNHLRLFEGVVGVSEKKFFYIFKILISDFYHIYM